MVRREVAEYFKLCRWKGKFVPRKAKKMRTTEGGCTRESQQHPLLQRSSWLQVGEESGRRNHSIFAPFQNYVFKSCRTAHQFVPPFTINIFRVLAAIPY